MEFPASSLLALVAMLANVSFTIGTVWGGRVRGDTLLLHKKVNIKAPPFGRANKTFIFQKSKTEPIKLITAIVTKGGVQAILLNGGPGMKHATFRLLAPPEKPLNATIDIYGFRG